MTSRERLLRALRKEKTDRLPVTTHHLMHSFLEDTMGGISDQQFFEQFGLDSTLWVQSHIPDPKRGEFSDPTHMVGTGEARRIMGANWRLEQTVVEETPYYTVRWDFHTPQKTLTMVTQANRHTSWIKEHLLKEKSDIEILAKYMPRPLCDLADVNRLSKTIGERGIVRGTVNCFAPLGQPGCWQDAACLFGIENLILTCFDDPSWVHQFLEILKDVKKNYIQSCAGAAFDIIELGGGDASSTVISPQIFRDFVAPYDSELISTAHQAGQRIVYHTCGGMMPLLEDIAAMNPDAMETFTPEGMGGDANLGEAKRRIGDKVCMIGGFDQYHFLVGCSPEETRAAVRKCFEEAGDGGGYILCPSDHFFEAEIPLLEAFADEAKRCLY